MKFLNRYRSFVVLIWFMGLFAFMCAITPRRDEVLAMIQDLVPPLLVFCFFMGGTLFVVLWALDEPVSKDSNPSKDEVSHE